MNRVLFHGLSFTLVGKENGGMDDLSFQDILLFHLSFQQIPLLSQSFSHSLWTN